MPLTLPSPAAPLSATPLALRLRHADTSAVAQVLGIAGFALLMTLGAQVRVPLWEVPFTLQTLAVYGAGLVLGARAGALSGLLYLAVGLFLPVFSAGEMGAAYLAGATGGYLVALPLVAFAVGAATERRTGIVASIVAGLVGMVVLFACGAMWLHAVAGHTSWGMTLARGVWPFLAADLLKVGAASALFAAAARGPR